ncbi:methyltransferase domain-containing protein [Undibacterium sp. SXout20W]|uniref:methyltransferase domain-containing protein n=1 Tax=Undibacterium sp. SXout20W TaxID=3413051 RepID=UPI003BEF89C2
MKCRHCQAQLGHTFLDLGTAPPSNAYLKPDQLHAAEVWLPLRLLVCDQCWLVQTEDFTGRESLFDEDYAYFSSYSSTWLRHAEQYVIAMQERFGLHGGHCVVEVAANDGYLLQYVKRAGIPCFGIEPTASTAAAARERGLDIISEFFGQTLAQSLADQGRQADLIAANNVLAHVPDINDFVSGFATLLQPSGVATFEFPHLLRMVQGLQFDTAYHEHYSYLSLTAVQHIFAANGLTVFDVEELPTHGGSLRVFAQRTDTCAHIVQKSVADLLAMEDQAGMRNLSFYAGFQEKAEKIKYDVLSYLIDCKRKGLRVAAYGAAAKGNTLLNFAGIRSDLLGYVVDANPNKQLKFLPGSRIPIRDQLALMRDLPDIILILPWNLCDEIIRDLNEVCVWEPKFVVAIPEIHVFDRN